MSKIRIDGDMLTVALESHSELSWYLDVETGEIIPVTDDFADPEIDIDELEQNSERYRYIEPIDSHDGFRIMEDFVVALTDSEARSALAKSLTRRKPFRNFKDSLCDFPEVEKQWFDYHEKTFWRFAQDWLETEEIDAELVSGTTPPEN